MDFIAEMVLGYSDTKLTEKIDSEKIEDYQILRYRDDYRIFVNSLQDGECILKCLSEVMIGLGLKLSSSKTESSGQVISSSIKEDKSNWLFRKQSDNNLQKHMLIIHNHSMQYPNAASVDIAMRDFYQRLEEHSENVSPLPLVSIVVDIAYRNPRTYPISAVILSKLISFIATDYQKEEIIKKIRHRFSQIPNTGYMQIWLQRVSFALVPKLAFSEPLCKLVNSENIQIQIWNNDWIASRDLIRAVDPKKMVESEQLATMAEVIPIEEIELFLSLIYDTN